MNSYSKFLPILIFTLFGLRLHAQELVPATSEDIQEFDRQVSKSLKQHAAPTPNNFGQKVSEEARKLKSDDSKNQFGKWVRDQRKKSDQGEASDTDSVVGRSRRGGVDGTSGDDATGNSRSSKFGRSGRGGD